MTIRITDDATRDEIAECIGYLKAKHDRLPAHFEDKRAELMTEIEGAMTEAEWLHERSMG